MRNLSSEQSTNHWQSIIQNITLVDKRLPKRLFGASTDCTAAPKTKTLVLAPEAIPNAYLSQISALLKTYLACDLPADQVISYFSQKYQLFALLISEDGEDLYGFVGLNVVNIDQAQLIYLGAVVVKAGFRGGGKLYRSIFYRVLWQKLRHPWKKSYLFGATVNPYAYASLARRIETVLPSPEVPNLPKPILQLAIKGLQKIYGLDSADCFDLEKGYGYPVISVQPLQEKKIDLSNLTLRFFVERNPDYQQGVGLIFVVPLTLRMMGRGFKTFLVRQ